MRLRVGLTQSVKPATSQEKILAKSAAMRPQKKQTLEVMTIFQRGETHADRNIS
jgi:hypothetical protein